MTTLDELNRRDRRHKDAAYVEHAVRERRQPHLLQPEQAKALIAEARRRHAMAPSPAKPGDKPRRLPKRLQNVLQCDFGDAFARVWKLRQEAAEAAKAGRSTQ